MEDAILTVEGKTYQIPYLKATKKFHKYGIPKTFDEDDFPEPFGNFYIPKPDYLPGPETIDDFPEED